MSLKILVHPILYQILTHLSYKSRISFGSTNKLYLFEYFPATGMQNGDEASPSNILAGQAPLVKMLISLDRMVYFVHHLYPYVF